MARGDHVFVRRGRRYSHHGIDCGDGTVIHHVVHRLGPRGKLRRVERTPYADFAVEATVLVRTHERRLSVEETMANAESRLGSDSYHLLRNNCEHFAAWCCTGRAASTQVRRWVLGSQGALAAVVAVEAIGAHLAIAAAASAGLCAMARPLRRRRGLVT